MTDDVKPGRRQMYAELTRTAVLQAARTLFISHGFEATSIDDIARLAQTSKGAVYHHFRDKREIFTEVYRASQNAIVARIIDLMTSESMQQHPWERVEAGTRLFLRSYVDDVDARALLRQVMGVLGWDGVRALDEETALPFLRATLQEFVAKGHARVVPIDATVEIFFSVFCNAILYIAAAADPDTASQEVETVIFTALEGLKTPSNRRIT
ncbi:MAG: TetR/AcrR family transcriptional regulator [Mycobacteriaceae bacterium]|nr:TetR/AcrR family transcriptional regulator [Mycobacteriaceae bacterium]MBV9640995.1 TetR/AcrR family transcriptional regulator [Mycobacteriaceae bacterium]